MQDDDDDDDEFEKNENITAVNRWVSVWLSYTLTDHFIFLYKMTLLTITAII